MWRLTWLYALFAALSIAVNIATQAACMGLYAGRGAVLLSILAGTGTGLVAKYLLDRRWIFHHVARDRRHEATTFLLYTTMGVATTLVFWGTELACHLLFGSSAMRYLGGVVGLVLGYVVKYQLDRRYVFPQAR